MMKSLLDQFVPTTTEFRPSTATEVFALRLAQKLGDAAAVRHYVSLTESWPEERLLGAYRIASRAGDSGSVARRFHVELGHIHGNGDHDRDDSVISVRIERRTIAAAIFYGSHLEYADARQLSSMRDKALASALGFVTWMLDRFPAESAALEVIPGGPEFQRHALHTAICHTLRDRLLPLWDIPKKALFEGFGYPPLSSRSELRQIATAIWPVVGGTHARVFIQDAALLGLYVQIERLFIIN